MTYDLAIVGGGPAGAAAGVYASRKRLKTLFITKDWNGQSAVSEGIENWIGDIKISGIDLAKKLENHVKSYVGDDLKLQEGEWCTKIEKIEGGFRIETDKAVYEAKTVLLTTGSRRRKLEVPGADHLEHKGLTYCASCDGPLFADQDVAVVGGGNAAFETAAQLLAYCRSVTLLVRGDAFKADPVTIEKVLKHPKMRAIKNAVPKEVLGEKFVSGLIYTDSPANADVTLNVTGIFVEIGSLPNTDMLGGLVDLDAFKRIKADSRTQMSSLPGIWAAGDCTDSLYHQNNIAAGDAVKALENIYLHLHAK